jgi:hypothetical protein
VYALRVIELFFAVVAGILIVMAFAAINKDSE